MSEMVKISKEKLAEIQANDERQKALIKTLEASSNKPNYGGTMRVDDQGRITGTWEDTGEVYAVTKRQEADGSHMRTSLMKSYESIRRAGYKPNATADGGFESFGHFINLGLKDPDEFKRRHLATVDRLKAIQGLSEIAASDGGALVMPEYSTNIFDRVYGNDLLSRTDQYTVSGNNMTFPKTAETSRANGSRHGGLRGYWVGEGDAATKSQPALDQLHLRLKKVAVVVYLTEELMSDAGTAVEAWVSRKAAEEFEFLIGDALINGSGGGQPLGMLQAPGLLSVAKETGQPAATIMAENIDNMWARRYAGSENYLWLKHQDTDPQLSQLSQAVGTGGSVLYRPPGGMADAPHMTLKGKPCLDTEFNATLGTVGDLLLCDMSRYVTITKGGISQAVSTHVEFLTDQTALKFTMRIDGAPWEDTAVTPFKGSNTQSPYVALATRS